MSSHDQPAGDLSAAKGFLAEALRILETLIDSQEAAFSEAVDALVESVKADGMIYLFGTGHSHMLAEEGHYRAGGLACVVPVLRTVVMLHEGAVVGTELERLPGLAERVLSGYAVGAGDVLIVFSNSGVNAVPVEAAETGRARGAKIIAVTSRTYSNAAAHGRKQLADLADIVIDNHGPAGDALFTLSPEGLKAGPISTMAGAAILNALMVQTAVRLINETGEAPVYVSANMPGAAERNAALVARYRRKNPHL